jgi:LPS export ABC transporter protein LptC
MLFNISRRNSLVLGVGIIALFFASGILMLLNSNSEVAEKEAIKNKAQPVEEHEKPNLSAPVTMSRFERHEIKDGKKLWEVTAEKGRYLPLANSAELEQSKLVFFRKDDSVIKLTSNNAKIIFSGTELKRAEVSGGVELIYNEKVKITSNTAVYDKTEDKIVVPGEVNIESENVDLSGKDLTAYVSKHEVFLASDVSTMIKPKKK